MIEIIKGFPSNVVGITVNGRVTKKDCYEVLMPAMAKSLKRHDNIRLYYELNSRFPGAAWEDLNVGIEHVVPCERVAIVTDIGWILYMVKALRFLIPGEIRVSRRSRRLRVAPGSPRLPDLLQVRRLLRRLEDAGLDLDDRGRGRQSGGRDGGAGRAEVRRCGNA
jgi:hypothetical protein